MSGTTDKGPDVLDVAIVGGGMAGTYAAYRLRNANKRIGLFECSNRIGGRLFTYHLPCCPSVNIELGGMRFIPQKHKILSGLIEELGLPVVPFPMIDSEEKPKPLYYLRGHRLTEHEILYGHVPYALNAKEKKNQHRLWNYFLEKILGLSDERTLFERVQDPEVAAKLHSMKFETALDLVASREGKAFVLDKRGLAIHAFIKGNASALLVFRALAGIDSEDETWTLKHGMSSLPLTLNKCFEESSEMHRTFLNHRLISIRKTEGKQYALKFQVTLAVTEDDHALCDIKDSVYETLARNVILALPVGALGAIQWMPFQEISFEQKRALIEITTVCKIFLVFNHPWWRDSEKCSSVTISDQIYRISIEFGSHEGTYVLMASYSPFTETFRTLQSHGKSIQGSAPGDLRVSAAMKESLLEQLSLTFGIPRSKIPEPIAGVAKFWDSSPFWGGIQCWKSGLLDQGVLERIKRPLLNEEVVVVGTDVSAKRGFEAWVEGCLHVVDEALSLSHYI